MHYCQKVFTLKTRMNLEEGSLKQIYNSESKMNQSFDEWQEVRLKLGKKTQPLLLLGAGASVESGGRTANSITKELLCLLYGDSNKETLKRQFFNQYHISATFENVLDKLGASGYEQRDLLIEFFRGLTLSNGYKYLAALLKAGYFYPIVISLNFDNLLENAIEKDNIVCCTKTIKILFQDEIPDDFSRLSTDNLWLIKLHGDIDKPDSLKITQAQTSKLTSPASRLLEELLVSQGLVSVGYRGGDSDILNALSKIGVAKKTVFWTTKSKSDSQFEPELAKFMINQSAKPLLNTGFDEFFSYLGAPLEAIQIRHTHQNDFEKCWLCLHNARGYSKFRSHALQDMEMLLRGPLGVANTWERDALKELLAYENCGHLLVYRLRQAVAYLQKMLDEQEAYLDKEERANLTYRLIEEHLNVFLAVDAIPERRSTHLLKAIGLAERLEEIATLNPIDKAKVCIKMGEMLKENAMLARDQEKQTRSLKDARGKLNIAINLLSKAKAHEEKYNLAVAHRHIAVTYELEGEITKSKPKRDTCYEKWRLHSEEAKKILRGLKEDSMSSYATMNIASSLTRIAAEEKGRPENKKEYLDRANKLLGTILKPLKKLDDHRGLGWAYYHICENLREQAKDVIDEKEKLRMFSEIEAHAYYALIELRQTLDNQAIGLAYSQLGLSAYDFYYITGRKSDERLNEAFWALNQAIERIEHSLYYKATGETCDGLSRYYKELAKKTGMEENISKSIEWRMRAIANAANRLGTEETLCPLLKHLDQEVKRLIQL